MGLPPGPSGQDGPHAFVADLDAPRLSGEDDHHLRRVQRLRPGGELTVSDGRGRWRLARLGERTGAVEAIGPIEVVRQPEPPITIAFALLKGDRNEWVVQKLTELGVDRIVPMTTERCVVRWDDHKAARNVERLRKVAREASMQSRRTWLPGVAAVTPFPQVAALPGAVRADRDGRPIASALSTVVLVGPEGGWSVDERVASPDAVALATGVLRAETAAITAAALVGAARVGAFPLE